MEPFSSLLPVPQSTMTDVPVDMQIPQQTLLPTSFSALPGHFVVQNRLIENNNDGTRPIKRYVVNEEKKEEEEEELLFDIDEFLVEEDALIHGHVSNSEDDATEQQSGARIIIESPTNGSSIPSEATTKDNIVTPSQPNRTVIAIKKKRKRRAKQKNSDSCSPPKRPLSAYNLYFREERKRCLNEGGDSQHDSKDSKKKYNFEELGKLIGKGWRALPAKEKRELEIRAEADRERYRKEMIAYRDEKRRKDREEDEDTLILMRHQHQGGPKNTCPPSPPMLPQNPSFQQGHGYSPSNQYSSLPRHVTPVSPGQQDYPVQPEGYQQHKQHKYNRDIDPRIKNHVRKVSSSMKSPHPEDNANYRSVNNRSPAVSSYGSCSSWSGDEHEDEEDSRKKHKSGQDRSNTRRGTKKRSKSLSDSNNSSLSSKTEYGSPNMSENVPYVSNLHVPRLENITRKSSVAVARVIAMPATDGLQRILQDGRRSEFFSPPSQALQNTQVRKQEAPPPPPHAWMPRVHAHPNHVYHQYPPHPQPHQHVSPPPPPLSMATDYPPHLRPSSALPPPPLSFFPHPSVQNPQHPPPPQMLPVGMEIIMQDPATGQRRSYRVQYTPQFMSADQANQFQRTNDGGTSDGQPQTKTV